MARQKKAKREDGRIAATFTYNGKRYYVYGYSQAELEEKKRLKYQQLQTGVEDRENPTLNAYYETRFTPNRRASIKESTLRCQSFQFRNCADIVIDGTGRTLGEMRIRDIKPFDVQAVQRALSSSGRTTETVNNCCAHLSHVFNAAVKDETIDRNPCKSLEIIRRTEKPARETIHRALSEQETSAFFAEAKESYYFNTFCLMLQTGMRIGEVGALLAADIDLTNKMLHIHQTITRDEIGGYKIGSTPKTDAGNREIPLTDQALKCIRDQRQLNALIFADKVERVIFRSPEGQLIREYSVNREIGRICKRAKIERFTCHSFRATFATRFIEQRPQDYKILSEVLGHSNTKITLDLYTHVMKENKITAMKNIHIAI